MSSESPTDTTQPPWHARSATAVLRDLRSSQTGLDAASAARRLAQYGPNRLPEAPRRGPLRRLLAQFNDVLIYVLLLSALVTAVLAHWVDTAVILGVVLINAVIGFVQEGRAEDALAAIRRMLSPRCLVIRDGRRITIDVADLVPGDVLPLQAGDRIAADARLLEANALSLDESALTGESVPVEKTIAESDAKAALGDRRSMVYSGTLVTAGQGLGVVVATGTETELGRISRLVALVDPLATPLLRQMRVFGRWLSVATLALAGFCLVFGVLVQGFGLAEMFLAAVGVAVAAIPEGLPAIMTITLAIGVQRMASRNAIIRRLPAVETLGTLSVICTDKTGTLTRNAMTVRALVVPGLEVGVSGSGYDPHGGFSRDGGDLDPTDHAALMQALRAMLLCNDASVHDEQGHWTVQGDPMEAALRVAAMKAGLDVGLETRRYPRTDLIPFDAAHKFMATLHHSHGGQSFVFVKGAPEHLLARCDREWSPDGQGRAIDHAEWEARVEALGRSGHRVIAVAMRRLAVPTATLTFADVRQDLELLGLCGLIDPPRPEAVSAIATCRAAGIRVKMITGDHRVTAAAIARQVGLGDGDRVLSGEQLAAMDDAELAALVGEVDVYARVSPEHKLRLVEQLQRCGHVVAMTGDGVNDAPALRRADIGVAMGQSGTEVAKDAAGMVLTDDNFATIVSAVHEGRTVYDNLRKAIVFMLPTSGGEALVMVAAILLGFEQFPLTPVQILWVNMVTAATLALALAFEPAEPGLMRRPPRDPRAPLMDRLLLWRVVFVSLILVAGTFGLFLWDIGRGADTAHARTVAVNTLVAFEIFYLFNSRYIREPALVRGGLFGNRIVLLMVAILVVVQLGFTYLPVMHLLFGTTALDAATWALVLLTASSVFWLVELEKLAVRRLQRLRR